MKKFEFLEHTADEKFLAFGKDVEEAFSNAALATFAIMTDVEKVKPVIEKKISVSGKNKERLLYEFLEELIFFVDTESFLLSSVESLYITNESGLFKLEAKLLGDDAINYEVTTQIKAVTYNDMFIKEERNLVTIQVVHDI